MAITSGVSMTPTTLFFAARGPAMTDDAGPPDAVNPDATTSQHRVTELLQVLDGSPDASGELLELIFQNLHGIAQQRMRRERSGHTLQATALVNEAYMRLIGNREMTWRDRGHFFAAAAEAMRRILIDHARKRNREKRGGGKPMQRLDVVDLAVDNDPETVLAVDDAIEQLAKEDERAAEVVRLRFYAGLSVEQVAEVLDISQRTVMREWSFARARLYQIIGDEAES